MNDGFLSDKRDNKSKHIKNILFLVSLFLLYFFFFGILSAYHKSARHECDPILYYQAAESIYYGRGMEYFGTPSTFITALYPLFVSPFFAINDVVLRIHMISLFNSTLMSSCIFPLYLLSKQILVDRRLRFAFVSISMLLPFTVMALEFMMVEVLYYPLLFWLLYILYININKKNYLISAAGGILTAIILFCKYIILCFFVAVILLPFILCLVDRFLNKKWSANRFLSKSVLINLAIYIVSFFAIFLTVKYAVFRHFSPLVENLFSRFQTFGQFAYFLYGFIHVLCAMAICSLVIPLVFPWFCLKKMKKELAYFFILIVLFFIVMAAVISYLIYINEDYKNIAPRPLSRYYMQCAPILLLFLFALCENKKVYVNIHNSSKIKNAIILTSLFICLFFRGVASQLDSDGLYIYGAIESGLINSGNDGFLRYFVVFFLTAFLCSLFYGLYLLVSSDKKIAFGKKKIQLQIIGVASLSLCFLSSLHGVAINRKILSIPENTIKVANNINAFINENPNSKILIINRYDRVLGIYLEHSENVIVVKKDKFESDVSYLHQGTLDISSFQFYSPRYNFPYKKTDNIDYIFFQSGVTFSNFSISEIESVGFDGSGLWNLFKNKDKTTLHFDFKNVL